jgi:4-amino-4-deoxy-L-arabinose transferase-like glycosyltransferase
MAPDSFEYDRLARTFIDTGLFDGPARANPTSRTPVYPMFLAVVYWLAGPSAVSVVLAQIAMGALNVLMVHLLARDLWSPRAGLVAGLLLACDAPSLSSSLRVLTDTLFTFLFVLAVMAALYRSEPETALSSPRALLFGLFLALAALCRPIGILLQVPALLWIGWCARRTAWRRGPTARAVLLVLAPWIVLVGGWQARNAVRTERFEVSHGPAKFLLLSRGADIVAQRDGISPAVARERLQREVDEQASRSAVPVESLYGTRALALITAHPLLFLGTQWRWLPELMTGTGAAGLLEALRPTIPLVSQALASLCTLQLLGVYLGVGACAFLFRFDARGSGNGSALTLLGVFIVYFVILSAGPQAYSRFRVPMMPLLIVCSAGGIDLFLSRRSDRAS